MSEIVDAIGGRALRVVRPLTAPNVLTDLHERAYRKPLYAILAHPGLRLHMPSLDDARAVPPLALSPALCQERSRRLSTAQAHTYGVLHT